MFRIANIEEINDNYSRKLGNQVIIDVSEHVKKNISQEYVFIRYMGPKFVIVFSGVNPEPVITFVSNMKNEIENMEISLEKEKNIEEIELEEVDRKKKRKKEKKPVSVKAKLNFALTTYYKGTGMEEVLKKLEQYIDNCDKSENDITCI